jgi:transcriptional regulator with XRE-family HTH domain
MRTRDGAPSSKEAAMSNSSTTLARIAVAIASAREDLGLSQSELSRLSGVSRGTIRRLEQGGPVRPELVVKAATAMTIVELYAPRSEQEAPAAALMPEWPPLPWPPLPEERLSAGVAS